MKIISIELLLVEVRKKCVGDEKSKQKQEILDQVSQTFGGIPAHGGSLSLNLNPVALEFF